MNSIDDTNNYERTKLKQTQDKTQHMAWEEIEIMCEDCSAWYHISDQNIGDITQEDWKASNEDWVCLNCGKTNHSKTLFDLHAVESESYKSLKDESASLDLSLL